MLSPEDNELLTRVGPGTPCGELLRRYWMPVAAAAELTAERPKKRVRILGEDLVLFRNASGELGLVQEHCSHRHVSLYHGFIEKDGLRCPYHGWKFAPNGECIEQPFEKPNSPLKAAACLTSYPLEELAGLIFTYMGPKPVPLLPRWETLVSKQGTREIGILPVHRCNWLQAQENSLDPTHTQWLHARMLERERTDDVYAGHVAYFGRPIENFDFELCHEPAWTGFRKSRAYGGDNPEKELGHPAIFPNILVVPHGKPLGTHWRVPVDDENTAIFWVEFIPSKNGEIVEQADKDINFYTLPHPLRADGEYDLTEFYSQDLMAWETQGRIFDRTTELTGAGDKGIAMFRKLLKEQILAVQNGKEPVGQIRDPKVNDIISFKVSPGQMKMIREVAAE